MSSKCFITFWNTTAQTERSASNPRLLPRCFRSSHPSLLRRKVASVFNWLADGRIKREALPSDSGFAITHIQVDEINQTLDQERRAKLVLTQASLRCELLPTQTFLLDVSRLDYARLGDGKLFMSIKAELDGLNGAKKNNNRDALIAETAIANGFTLLTADRNLRSVTETHGGIVIFFPPSSRPSQRPRTS